MLSRILAAAALACLPFVANAASLTVTDGIASDFDEIAVGQIRGGGTGTFELAVIPGGTTDTADEEDVTWTDGTAVDFEIDYDAASMMLSVSALGKTAEALLDLTGANAMAIFARTFNDKQPAKSGELSLTDMTLNGMALDDILPPDAYSATVTGMDFGSDFTLAGSALFDFVSDGSEVQSNLAASFKFGTVPPVVPLPASALLLLAGMGGLAAMRRRAA